MEKVANTPTLIYGEVEVLISRADIYYIAFEWTGSTIGGHGYCGIEDHAGKDGRNVLFSIWDTGVPGTNKKIEARIYKLGAHSTGAHGYGEGGEVSTGQVYPWKETETFRFILTKKPDYTAKQTLVSFYFFDQPKNEWVFEGTILTPFNPLVSEGSPGIFTRQEDFSSKKPTLPRLSMIRIWLGFSPKTMTFLSKATELTGHWGVLNGCFCCAGGDRRAIEHFLAAREGLKVEVPIHWAEKEITPKAEVNDQPLPPHIVDELTHFLEKLEK
jgi:hypothetical protein